jgi:hypothetical protein
MSGHVHSANCSHGAPKPPTHQQEHVHSANCSHGAPKPVAQQQEHVHSANCSHGKAAARQEHVHSANCSHGAPKAQEHVHSANCSHGKAASRPLAGAQPKMMEGSSSGHVHGPGCSHGEKAAPQEEAHPEQDLTVIVYGGEMPECKTPEERAVAIETLATPAVGDLIGKIREMWRLGRVLFEKKSYPMSLHLFAECVRLGCRWLMVGEGPKYWGHDM